MPKPSEAPELRPTRRGRRGIRIGGTAGEIDVNFCLNTMCGNFGLSWSQAEERGRPYRLQVQKKRRSMYFFCGECGSHRKAYSNRAVDAAFLHALKHALPHEYCEFVFVDEENKTQNCDNCRVNFYEHFPTRYTCRAYNPANSDYRAGCRNCGKSVQVGIPWRRHGDKGRAGRRAADPEIRYLSDVSAFMKMVCIGCGPSQVTEFLDCREEHYYALLRNLAAACNSISGYFLMKLQSGRYSGRKDHFRLYSDIMTISFRVVGKNIRHSFLKYAVTVTDCRDSYFALAATPLFFQDDSKDSLRKELHASSKEAGRLECYRKHAHLLGAGADTEAGRSYRTKRAGFPLLGQGGYASVLSYGALGHFLLLRKMLSGVERVTHYVDSEPVLRVASVTAFADRILERRCDVVGVSTVKKLTPKDVKDLQADARRELKARYGGRGRAPEKLRKRALTDRIADLKSAFRKEVEAYEKKRLELQPHVRRPNAWAHVFGKACHAAIPGKAGKAFGAPKATRNVLPQLWVRDPHFSLNEPDRRFLWLTRGRSGGDKKREAELYLAGKLQPVDTFFSSLRQVASTAQRPPPIAGRHHIRGFGSLARSPAPIISELALLRFFWNFMRRRRTSGNARRRYVPRASDLGIFRGRTLGVEEAPTFREGVFQRAEEITQWLGR